MNSRTSGIIHRGQKWFGILAAAALLAGSSAGAVSAQEIWVNGVKVDRLEPASVANCTVEFDTQGRVFITTPRNAAVVPAPPPPDEPPPLSADVKR